MLSEADAAVRPSTILFLAANPVNGARIRLDEECREIEKKISAGRFHERLRFRSRWAVRPDDLLLGFLEDEPTVLHFSGHGAGDAGLWFQGEDGKASVVTADMLNQMMCAGSSSIKVVVLNACYSEVQARAVILHIPCVIGMPHAIRDTAATAYASAFYRALAFGQSVGGAHQHGLAALANEEGSMCAIERDIDVVEAQAALQRRTPVLLTKAGVDARQIVVVTGPDRSVAATATAHAPQVHLELNIDSEFHQLDTTTLAAMISEIRRLIGGGPVRIVCIAKGSVRLTVSLSAEAAALLMELRNKGQLTQVCGSELSNVVEVARIESRGLAQLELRAKGERDLTANRGPEATMPAGDGRLVHEDSRIGNDRESVSRGIGSGASTAEKSAYIAALASLPILPLANCVLLPGGLLPLHVFEPRYRELTRDCLAGHQLMGIARLRPGYEMTYYGRPPVYEKCVVGRIICSEELPDDRFKLLLRGVARAEIARELPSRCNYRLVEARPLHDAQYDPLDAHDHHRRLIQLCDRLAEVIEEGGSQLRDLVRSFDTPGACADAVAAALVMDADARQELLEARDPMVRLQRTLSHVEQLLGTRVVTHA